MQKIVIITVVVSIFFTACAVSKKTVSHVSLTDKEKDTDIKHTVESVINNNITNQNFYIQKADIKLTQNDISVRFTTGIRFKKPDSLLVIVRTRSGIEVGRAFVTKDTILINDRINKKLLIGNPEMIKSKYGIEPSIVYTILGDVMINKTDKERTYKCIQGQFKEEFEYNNKKIEYTFDCSKMKAIRTYFEGDINTGNITILYSEIIDLRNIKFPRKININDDLQSINILIDIEKIESPWNGRIGFVSGAGYQVIKIR